MENKFEDPDHWRQMSLTLIKKKKKKKANHSGFLMKVLYQKNKSASKG